MCESGGSRLKPQIICQTKSGFKLLCFTWQEGQVIAAFGWSWCICSNVTHLATVFHHTECLNLMLRNWKTWWCIWHQKNECSVYSSFHWAISMDHNQEKAFSQTNSISLLLQVHLKLQVNVFIKQPNCKNVRNNTVLDHNKGNAASCSVSRNSTWGKHMSLLLPTVSSPHTSPASIIVALSNIRRYYPWTSPGNVSRFLRNVSNPFLNQPTS